MLQILSTVLERGEPSEVLSLIVTAAQCMREVAVDKKLIEFRHPGKGEEKLTKTVSQRRLHQPLYYGSAALLVLY